MLYEQLKIKKIYQKKEMYVHKKDNYELRLV